MQATHERAKVNDADVDRLRISEQPAKVALEPSRDAVVLAREHGAEIGEARITGLDEGEGIEGAKRLLWVSARWNVAIGAQF